jgi:hypothetical protein
VDLHIQPPIRLHGVVLFNDAVFLLTPRFCDVMWFALNSGVASVGSSPNGRNKVYAQIPAISDLGFFTAVTMKSVVFWDIKT